MRFTRRGVGRGLATVAVIAAAGAVAVAPADAGRHHSSAHKARARTAGDDRLDRIKHVVVIYEENHSFDNLYGGWEGVNGLADADAAHTVQINQAGNAYACLKQDDVNLTSPPLAADVCSVAGGDAF